MTSASRPETCVGAVIVESGHLLLVRRGRGVARGQWSIPGGRVERGETLAEAVVREVREETGLAVTCGALVGWVERIADSYHFVILDFFAHVEGAELPEHEANGLPGPLRAGDDAADAVWAALDGLESLDLVDGLAQFLADHGVIGQKPG